MSQNTNQCHLPKGDVSYIRATSSGPYPPMSSPTGTGRESKNAVPLHFGSSHWDDCQWNEREEMLVRELEEAKIRTAQMEKTMRWWSDCTANWREKWNKARNERNKSREENRQLRTKLDALAKEGTVAKRDYQTLTLQVQELQKQVEQLKVTGKVENNDSVSQETDSGHCLLGQASDAYRSVEVTNEGNTSSSQMTCRNLEQESGEKESDLLKEKLLLKQKLEQSEQEKSELSKSVDQLNVELEVLRKQLEDEKKSRQETMLELQKQEAHLLTMHQMSADLENETSVDSRVAHLRLELEKLQAENAEEWNRSELLQTEKLGFERENKQLRSQLEDLEEQLERRTHQAAAHVDADLRTIQLELSEKHKELNEICIAHTKVKKMLAERTTELEHNKRRNEQYEVEVKKLRCRIEELKKDLARAEDEVDVQTNNVRRLQRNNDELQEQADSLQVQVEHLTSRLRRNSAGPLTSGQSSSLKSLSLESGGVGALGLDSDDGEWEENM